MTQPVRISAVSYLNSKPYINGIVSGMQADEYSLTLENPAESARSFIHGNCDIALMPVAGLQNPEEELFTSYGIGCTGAVGTVCLYSESPISNVKQILLDYQSKTSVALVRILAQKHWNITPEFVQAAPGYETAVHGTTAALVIGDRTFALNDRFKFTCDLGKAWMDLTGLPFMFAHWAKRITPEHDFTERFEKALESGVAMRHHVIDYYAGHQISRSVLMKYYDEELNFRMTTSHYDGLTLFLRLLAELHAAESGPNSNSILAH